MGTVERVANGEEKLLWQGGVRILSKRILKIQTPQGHGSGFHIGQYGTSKSMCAIATAWHVISHAHEWGEPIKINQASSGKEVLLKSDQRAIFSYKNRDLGVITFNTPKEFDLEETAISFIPTNQHLADGVEVAWLGFPGIKSDKACFFHGYISCYLAEEGCYLIDGVAINGVSGGPVFAIDHQRSNRPAIAGVITAYIANRATGEILPGLSMITSIAPALETVRILENLPQATQQAEEQNQQQEEGGNTDPLKEPPSIQF